MTRSTARDRRASRHLLPLTALALCACGAPDGAASDPAEGSFAAFAAATYREPGSGLYIVDGDTPVRGLDALRRFYGQHVTQSAGAAVGKRQEGLVVHRSGGADARWSDAQKRVISYCVSTSFGANYSRVVQAMSAATAAWEQSAYVRFYHRGEQDATCTAQNSAVVFDVNPIAAAPFMARAFFPNDPRSDRNILIAPASFSDPVWSLTGVLRHELGHALGFRHEHTRPEAGVCFEDSSWRALTPYDSASVMHYPSCNGSNRGDLVLTARDSEGAAGLYGAPPPRSCKLAVTADRASSDGSTAAQAADGSQASAFRSSYNDWQHLQIDLGCAGQLRGLRRYMSRNGSDTSGTRGAQGEAVSYSSDGVTWTALSASGSSGWGGYVNYAPTAWHTVPYGYSAWLRPVQAVTARYVRFRWDGNSDSLHEVELDFTAACARAVSSDRPGLGGTTAAQAADGSGATFFRSSYDNWQYLQMDLGCLADFEGLQRLMTRDGASSSGDRGAQGEGASYSADGVTWTSVTGAASSGWGGYVNYAPTAWHTVPYGTSAWLRLSQPARARYVRFQWDGNLDALNEVTLSTKLP